MELQLIIITSLKCVFVYEGMKPEMVLHPLRRLLEWFVSLLPDNVGCYIQKPLFCCLFCTSSLWGMLFTAQYFAVTWDYLTSLFAIAGCNFLFGMAIGFMRQMRERLKE